MAYCLRRNEAVISYGILVMAYCPRRNEAVIPPNAWKAYHGGGGDGGDDGDDDGDEGGSRRYGILVMAY